MGLKSKLDIWVEQGFIKQAQVENILAFEKGRNSGWFMKGLYGLGIFSILLGVLAIIASNWHAIPPSVKIGAHIILNGVLAVVIVAMQKQQRNFIKELLIFALFGLTLTLIALIGQVYQLDGSIASAIILWMLISTPFILVYGEGRISLIPWILGLFAFIHAVLFEYLDFRYTLEKTVILCCTVYAYLPIALVGLSYVFSLYKKPVLKNLLVVSAVFVAVVCSSIAASFWSVGFSERAFVRYEPYLSHLVIHMVVAGIFTLFMRSNERRGSLLQSLSPLQWIFLASYIISVLPVIFLQVESSILSALFFILYWGILGYFAQVTERYNWVSFVIFVIAARIYIVYVELFGSLITTGFGLIFSGCLLIFMIWSVRKLSKVARSIDLDGDHA